MTAFAIDFRADRVAIASDTAAYRSSAGQRAEPLGFTDKVLAIPRLRLAAFGRGQIQILRMAALELSERYDLESFDAVAPLFGELFNQAATRYAASIGLDDHRQVGLLDAALVGWSPVAKRMRAITANNTTGFAAQYDNGRQYGVLSMPPLGSYMPSLSGTSSDETLIAIMKAEQRFFDENAHLLGGAVIGGEVHVTTITSRGIDQRCVYRFENYDQLKAEGAANYAKLAATHARGEALNIAAGLTPANEIVHANDVNQTRSTPMPRQQRRQLARQQRA